METICDRRKAAVRSFIKDLQDMPQEPSTITKSKYSVPIRSALKIIAFFMILAFLLVGAGILLNPGRWFLEGRIKDRNARDAEITTIPRDCIDIYNIGNSLAMVGISPMDLWKDEGFTSFNLCKGAAKTSEAYYLLKHGLDYQHPDLILIESNMLFRTDDPLSDLGTGLTEFFEYYFPFCRYHNLWQAVGSAPSLREYYMGYLISEHILPYTGDTDYLKPTDERKKIERLSTYYMDRILRLCEKNDIDVIFYSLCSPKCYDTTRLNSIRDYAQSRGLTYIDLNQNWEEIGIDWSHDTRDEGDHLNEYGVAKVTSYIGNFLRENYSLTDHRGEPEYSDWDTLYAAYEKTLEKMEGVSYYMLEGDEIYD